jgi:hypothetical protein
MKHYPVIITLIAGVILSSCGKKTRDFANSIPDDAIVVASMHPMDIYKKGRLNTLQHLKEKVKGEVWEQILEDPLSTGLMLDEYTFVFVKMEEEAPVIGVVSGMKDTEKFESTLGKIDEDIKDQFIITDDYTYIIPDEDGIVAWNKDQMIVLASPDADEFEPTYLTETLDSMFHPLKEASVTSLVDFKDFLGKMKDLNFWICSDQIPELMEKAMKDSIRIDLPVTLYNNYAQVYCEFADGEMYVTGETHFSEEVEKNLEEVLVMKPSLNKTMLELAPGDDLLMAIASSMDLDKIRKLVKKSSVKNLGEIGDKLEQTTGISGEEMLDALTGDFVISVNGVKEEGMIPLEVFIGLGVNNDMIQEKLMGKVDSLAPVEQQGTFFIINAQGNEIYSGIVKDIWVITNAKGYNDAVSGGKLENSLTDSKFSDFAGGSLGMYLNLDLSAYPSMIQGVLNQKPHQKEWIEYVTASFNYLGMSAGNYESRFTLETNKPDENSLYTILKMTDIPE